MLTEKDWSNWLIYKKAQVSRLLSRKAEDLRQLVGKETTQEIINSGYKRILAEVAPDGSIVFKELNGSASVIGTFTP